MEKQRVVYIMGTSRSGSTILDLAIGSWPGVYSAGELNNLFRSLDRREYCSCGVPGVDCEFWQHVLSEWSARAGHASLAEMRAMREKVETPRLLLGSERAARSEAFAAYSRCTIALFSTLHDLTDAAVIVDSSKSPLRALALSLCSEIDLRLVHIVRDPRAVVWSQRKPFRKDLAAGIPKDKRPQSVVHTAVSWNAVTLLANRMRRRLGPGRAVVVRYEDFVRDPSRELERIAGSLPIDAPKTFELPDSIDVSRRHIVAGNRLRMSGKITIRPDLEWPAKLRPHQVRTCELIAGPLMRRFGYQHLGATSSHGGAGRR